MWKSRLQFRLFSGRPWVSVAVAAERGALDDAALHDHADGRAAVSALLPDIDEPVPVAAAGSILLTESIQSINKGSGFISRVEIA